MSLHRGLGSCVYGGRGVETTPRSTTPGGGLRPLTSPLRGRPPPVRRVERYGSPSVTDDAVSRQGSWAGPNVRPTRHGPTSLLTGPRETPVSTSPRPTPTLPTGGSRRVHLHTGVLRLLLRPSSQVTGPTPLSLLDRPPTRNGSPMGKEARPSPRCLHPSTGPRSTCVAHRHLRPLPPPIVRDLLSGRPPPSHRPTP